MPTTTDDAGDVNNIFAATTCTSFLYSEEQVAAGVFDWRDAIIYFVFVDHFFDGDPTSNCNVAGASSEGTPGTTIRDEQLHGGDWQGVTQQINAGYFNNLGVARSGSPCRSRTAIRFSGPASPATTAVERVQLREYPYQYSAYAGYWPTDPGAVDGGSPSVEKCFGTAADLHALVAAAHANNLKVLFDYAMVDALDTGAAFTNNASWFTEDCQCGDTADGCSDYNDYQCWFTPYLAHFDFSGSSAAAATARAYSINGALALAEDLQAMTLFASTRSSRSIELAPVAPPSDQRLRGVQAADGGAVQHFYMVGETYDFEDHRIHRQLHRLTTALDGQFDFPLRYRLVDVMLRARYVAVAQLLRHSPRRGE